MSASLNLHLLSKLAPRRSRSSSPPHSSSDLERSRSPSPKAAPAPPLMDPTTIARISRRKLAAAANEAATRDSIELRKVILIQGAMQAAATASAATSRAPSPPRPSVYAQQLPEIVVSPPIQLPPFGDDALQNEERWFQDVLDGLDSEMEDEEEVASMVTVHPAHEGDSSSDGTISEAGSDGYPSLEEFFYPPPPPYSYSPQPQPARTQQASAVYPPPLPDSFAADAWDDYDDGSEKVNLVTLFSDVDLGAAVSAAANAAANAVGLEKPERSEYAQHISVLPPGYGIYPPSSPYEFAWPSSPHYDAVVY